MLSLSARRRPFRNPPVFVFRPSNRATTARRSSGNHAPAAMASRPLIRSGRRWGAGLRRHGVLHRLGDRLNHGGRAQCPATVWITVVVGSVRIPPGSLIDRRPESEMPLGGVGVHAAPVRSRNWPLDGLSSTAAGPPADDAIRPALPSLRPRRVQSRSRRGEHVPLPPRRRSSGDHATAATTPTADEKTDDEHDDLDPRHSDYGLSPVASSRNERRRGERTRTSARAAERRRRVGVRAR